MASKPRLYSDRFNQDGSFDSICLTCFATVGGCKPSGQLDRHAKTHVCDSAFLAERGIFTQSKSAKRSAQTHLGGHVYSQTGEAA